MLEYIGDLVKITCDKCGVFETARKSNYNDIFYSLGWGVSPRSKKYIHRCAGCLVKAGFKSYRRYL